MNPVSTIKTTSAITGWAVSCAVNGVAKKTQNPAFKLLRFLKKRIHSCDEIDAILCHLSEEEKCIGVLPYIWRRLFKPSEIRQRTFDIHTIFLDFAKKFQKISGEHSDTMPILQCLAKTLKKYLNTETQVSFVDSGMFGSVVRITGGKEDLALKVFHQVPETMEPFALSRYKLHGQTIELQNAVALSHGLKPARRARFYMGKVTSLGEDGGYMLSEYVSGASPACSKYSPRGDFIYNRFVFGDALTMGNIRNGKIVDYGDVTYRFANRKQEEIAKELFPLICKGDIPKILDLKKIYLGNPDFDAVVNKSSERARKFLSYTYNLPVFMEGEGAKEVLSSLNALGVDFPALRTCRYFQIEQIKFLRSVGILK